MKVFQIQGIFLLAASVLSVCSCNEEPQKTAVALEKINLDKTELALEVGENYVLVAEAVPSDAEGYVLSWSSSAPEIASVDSSGLVTAISPGKATIEASSGNISAACEVTVKAIGVESIELNMDKATIQREETLQLTATVLPENADDKSVEWSSSDESIASVDSEGLVTGIGAGEASITATAGEMTAECSITVLGIPVESIELDVYEIEIQTGETRMLTATVLPENADDKTVSWSSSDESVATVNDGTVTAIAAGTASVTASCGDIQASCSVTVTAPSVSEPEIGSFYYSDGTWSSEPDNTKTMIGIVFWTGNPSQDDTILATEHPECTHGLVVSLEELEGPWQSNTMSYGALVDTWISANLSGYESILGGYGYDSQDNLNKMLGYNNTKAIEAFNNDPANSEWTVDVVENIQDFNESSPAPEGTSGWYLMSAKEASLLVTGSYDGNIYEIWQDITNANNLNGILSQIGAETLSNSLWTSTEIDAYSTSMIYSINCTDALLWTINKDYSNYNYRYILAF